MAPRVAKSFTEWQSENEVKLEPGSKIAITLFETPEGKIGVSVVQEMFQSMDDEQVDKIIDCVRLTIDQARGDTSAVEFLN